MKLAIVGSRAFTCTNSLDTFILDHVDLDRITHIVPGGASGADTCAEEIAEKYGKEMVVFKPYWDKYGKSAGYRRNVDIITNSDVVVAAWDGESKGTKHSIDIANQQEKPVHIFRYDLRRSY